MNIISAGTTAYLTVAPVDQNGNPAAPTSGTFRVDDVGSGQALVPKTALTPGTSMTITLSTVATGAIGTSTLPQTRAVTVELSYGTNDGLTAVYLFQVQPLQFP